MKERRFSRVLAMLLAVMMVITMMPTMAFAADRDTGKDQVRVTVENTTYSAGAWTGTLVDTWVDIDSTSSAMSCIAAALKEGGYSQSGAESGYISEVNGIMAGSANGMDGWMIMINDWMINAGADQFTVADGSLESGDEIRLVYSMDMGEDHGGSWSNNDKTVKALSFSTGTLNTTFDSATHEYTLTVASDTTSVVVTPTATNKNFQVHTNVDGTEYKRSDSILVENGTVITVTCGDPSWPSMNNGEYGNGAENVPAEVYTITVDVEKAAVKGTEVTVTDNVIDITDKTIYTYFSGKYYANATGIKIEGASVSEAYEDGTDVYIVLSRDTADDAVVSATVNTVVINCTVSGNTGNITLEKGEGVLKLNVKAQYRTFSNLSDTVPYNLIFIREAAPTESPVCVKTTDTAEVWKGNSLEINLKDYFTGADQYYLVEGTEKTLIEGKVYTYIPTQAGEQNLVFAAANEIGTCPEQLTVTVTVKEIKGGTHIGYETSNGSLDSVVFTDADGNEIEGLEVSYADKVITASVPKDYDVNGSVKAVFTLTQNDSGLPFITTKTGTSGTSSGKAVNNKFTEKTTALSAGAATFTFYYYNTTPATNSNNYTTFTINYAIVNELPVLAEGQAASTDATVTAGQPYTFALGEVFSDADGDTLTYSVNINGADAVTADIDEDGNYSYTNNEAGTYTLVFTANDGKGTSTATYTVNLTVENSADTYDMTVSVPEGLEPAFSTSNGDNLNAVKGTTAEGVTIYTVACPANAESIVASAEGWGSVEFASSENGSVQLRQVKLCAEDLKGNEIPTASEVSCDGQEVKEVTGDSNQYLLVAGKTYTYTVKPEENDKYADNSLTQELQAAAEPLTVTIETGYKNAFEFTVPTGAKAQLYKYNQYYSFTESTPLASRDNEDGTTTFYFNADTKNGEGWVYRVSMSGKITKAGYIAWGTGSLNIGYNEDDPLPSERPDYANSSAANSAVAEDSVLLNVNAQNNLALSVGDTKTLKAYRAWEIIKLSYQNYIITPDFHFTILEGEDVVSLTDMDSASACDGDWKTLTALKEGTAIIEVTYDAIEVKGGSYDGTYGASDPARTGLVVVQVGGHDSSVDFGIESKASKGSTTYSASNAKSWDAEFDTLYFTGNSGELTLKPAASGSTIQKVEVSNDKGTSWTELTGEDGKYTATITSGNNIIRVTTDKGTAYQVVRGDKIVLRYVELDGSSDGDGIIEAGETLRIYFDGIHMPIPKMAGNYNPSYTGNTDGDSVARIRYTFNGETVQNNGSHQYNFITAGNYVDVTMPTDAEDGTSFILSDGYIGVGVIGLTAFTDGGDSHRNIPDAGCTTRGSSTTFHTRSMMPELTLTVGQAADPNNAPNANSSAAKEASISLGKTYRVNPETLFTDKDGNTLNFTVSINGGDAKSTDSSFSYTPDAVGTYTLKFTASDGKAEAEHTITLTVTEAAQETEKTPTFNVTNPAGYVTVSFVDFATRKAGETGLKYPTALGTIVPATSVPYIEGDTIADVTLRLLDAYGIGYEYSGTVKSNFYLSAIKNFEVNNTSYSSMGEFDAGNGSGWMITHNGTFIDKGASAFTVSNGDVIKWQYTCQMGADIGDPYFDDKKEEAGAVEGLPEDAPTVTLTDESGAAMADGGKVSYDSDSKTLTITVSDGYELKDVKVNGVSKGAVTTLAGLTKDDKVEVIFAKSIVEESLDAEGVKVLLAELTPVARSVKTANRNVKVTVKLDAADKAIIEQIEAAGYTVKYNYYRSTKTLSGFRAMLMKDGKTYTNTIGKKSAMYYYKVRVQVYDQDGSLVGRTALKQCRYANRLWTK